MADKTLNDQIEGIFQGVVFILLSFLTSVLALLFRPQGGYISLVTDLRRKGSNQVRPYVFSFLAVVLVLFLPTTIAALAPHSPGAFEYQVHDSERYEVGGLGRAYGEAAKKVETKAATSIFIAAAVGVAALHICVTSLGWAVFPWRPRRATWRDSVFFVAGLQFVLLGAALVVSREGWSAITEFRSLQDLLLSPWTLVHGYGEMRQYPLYIDLLSSSLLVVVALVPLAIAIRFGRRASFSQQKPASAQSARKVAAWTVLLLLGIDISSLGSFAIAAYVSDEIQPQEKQLYPFAIRQLGCTVRSQNTGTIVTADAVLTIVGNEAWYFEEGDFKMFVAADRVESDGPAARRGRTSNPKRIGAGAPLALTLSAVSPKLGPLPFLVEPGRSVLVRFEAEAPPSLTKFLDDHPDAQRCTVYYTNDYPIGAIGVLAVKS